ncbi:PPM-type phosphatase domain-containing protein [Mycena venus]|uniref:PPM-type phosphatase domain-containing protein n=1 Tax=Mycena venus TaxID=2733690 RepID=A0A8H6XGK5_9AGAR|nr:PPM-type phosphatase domain-containing protein [Mycena venus]
MEKSLDMIGEDPQFMEGRRAVVTFDDRDWKKNGHQSPPYCVSLSPCVRRYDLLHGDMLKFASDGFRDWMDGIPAENRLNIIMSLANEKEPQKLGHACIRPEFENNAAELLIKMFFFFGQDSEKMAKELPDSERDDISVVIVDFGWGGRDE